MVNIITVKGMMCQHCAQRVTKALLSIDGVEKAEVDYETGKAKVLSEDVSEADFRLIIEEAGYEVTDFE